MNIDPRYTTASRTLLHPGERSQVQVGEGQTAIGDGVVDSFVLPDNRERYFTSAEQLRAVMKDSNGEIQRAQDLLDRGASKVKVDVGLSRDWVIKKGSRGTLDISQRASDYETQVLQLTPTIGQAVLTTNNGNVDHTMELFAGRERVRELFEVKQHGHIADHNPAKGEEVHHQSSLRLRPGQYGDLPFQATEHRAQCDGVVDEFIFDKVYNPTEKLRSTEQLRPLFESREVDNALALLRDGADAVEIDMGTSTPWEISKDSSGWETYKVATDPLRQEISFKPRAGEATLITRAETRSVMSEELTHEMKVSRSPDGHLLCEMETFDQSVRVH
jgi:hypothetical protein